MIARDGAGNTGERDYTIVITADPPIVISPATLPNGQVRQPYGQTLAASGGIGAPYTFQAIAAELCGNSALGLSTGG